jgi:L-2-hydroxycarboxylate dehydrogenase (NAD+)
VAGFIGGSLPTIRNRWDQAAGDRGTCCFYFQVIHPDAINGGAFAKGRNQQQNVAAVIADVLGHGNEKSMLPGQLEADWAKKTAAAGGLLFSKAEVDAFNELATEAGQPLWKIDSFKTVSL